MKKNKKKKLKKQEIREQEPLQMENKDPVVPKKRACLFIDTENVGSALPETRLNKLEIYFYWTNHPSGEFSFPEWTDHKSFHLLDIRSCQKGKQNELDFVIISDMAVRIARDSDRKRRKTHYFLLSRDKGYDTALGILRLRYPDVHIQRVGLCAKDFCSIIPEHPGLLELPDYVFNDERMQHAAFYSGCYGEFREKLNAEQRRLLRLYPKPKYRGIWIEKNFFTQKFEVYSSGGLRGGFEDWEQALVKLEEAVKTCPDKVMLTQSRREKKRARNKKHRQNRAKRNREMRKSEFLTFFEADALRKQEQEEAARKMEEKRKLTLESLMFKPLPESGQVPDEVEEFEESMPERVENLFGSDLNIGLEIPKEGLFF